MWKQAVEKAKSTDTDKVVAAMGGQTFAAPDGFTIKMDEKNHHLWKPVFIGEVPDQRIGVDAAQFFLSDREGDHRHVRRLQALVAELLVEGNVGVAVDGGDDRRGLALGEALDVRHDGLVVAVAEGRVDLLDVRLLHML